jgi:hypothetical protein
MSRHPTPFRRAALGWAAGYVVMLCVVGFWPTPVDQPISGVIRWFLRGMHRTVGVPSWLDYGQLEFAANVALFVPLGLLVGFVVGRRRAWLAALIGLGLSTFIELGQWLALPERTPSGLDVAANTLGCAIGAAIAVVVTLRGSPRRLSRR